MLAPENTAAGGWEGPALLISLLCPQCMVGRRHSVLIWGFNPLITEGDGGRGLESQGMWLRTARGVHISLTRQQGPPGLGGGKHWAHLSQGTSGENRYGRGRGRRERERPLLG